MRTAYLKGAIILAYAIFAILLNSVGTVILQAIDTFAVTKVTASTLEAFKDLSIAIASFLLASSLPRFGYRRGMIVALALVALACMAMPLFPGFGTTRCLFLAVGIGFAITKVSVYSLVGLLTDDASGHSSLLNLIEGCFMLAVLGGYWLFSAFIDPLAPQSLGWLNVYWLLAALCGLAIVLLAFAALPDAREHGRAADAIKPASFSDMLKLVALPLTLVFVACLFFYVLVEQGIGSWLPTFNRQVLHLSAPMSVQAASIFAAGLALGRLGAGLVIPRLGWFRLLIACLVAMAVLLLVALPLAAAGSGAEIARWSDAPIAAFILPLIGLSMGPIYPALNSVVLSAMPRASQAGMVGLIVVFSALGGTTGSLIVGRTFGALGGTQAFYLLLVPLLALLCGLVLLRNLQDLARGRAILPEQSRSAEPV